MIQSAIGIGVLLIALVLLHVLMAHQEAARQSQHDTAALAIAAYQLFLDGADVASAVRRVVENLPDRPVKPDDYQRLLARVEQKVNDLRH
jgi:hypothetical protein